MKKCLLCIALAALSLSAAAENRVFDPQVKSLQAVVNQDWLSPAVMSLGSDDVLNVSFDELSHDNHRYVYRLELCEPDWSESHDAFESEWLEGFNDNVVENYERSVNTVVPYTHYRLQIPNEKVRMKRSGNYRLHLIDDDTGERLFTVDFMIAEQSMNLELRVTTNTDVDLNANHQQMSIALGYGKWQVTDYESQIRTTVMQNGKIVRQNVEPSYQSHSSGIDLKWDHNRKLIFDAGNEYRKFEILDPSHPTMGIERIVWDGNMYQAYPFTDEPRPNYIYDEDADGAFYIRNSDNSENDVTSEYVWVNYQLKTAELPEGQIVIDGQWTTGEPDDYVMNYDEESGMYTANVLQKQGYYSYRYLWKHADGSISTPPSEGNYYQTENRYQAIVYYKGTGERIWRLTAYRQLIFQ